MQAPRPMTLWHKIAYACGQAGNVLLESLIATYLLVFYLPPAKAGQIEQSLVPKVAFWVIGTIGFVNLVSRGLDTFLDPLVANWSDRSTSKFGRRRLFMMIGCVPLAALTALTFFPPTSVSSGTNIVFLAVVQTLFYAFFSMYVAPYLALLPELTPDKKDNVFLSTMMAAFALVGALLAINGGSLLIGALGESTFEDKMRSIQLSCLAFSIIGFVLILIPVLAIDEVNMVKERPAGGAHLGLVASLKKTLGDHNFLPYVIGTVAFSFGFNLVRSALPYFIEVLIKKPIDYQPAQLAVFVVAAASFPFVGMAATRFGKRPVMIAGTVLLATPLALFYFVDGAAMGVALLAVCGLGVGVFLAIPNAMLSDICNACTKRTGEAREAMFFGAQGFLQKINLGVSIFVLEYLINNFGRGVDNPLGVQLAGPAGAVALIIGAIAYSRYDEKRVMAELQGQGPLLQERVG
jgi:glycoside/pentoside/hexuronide:cation symporter, GPH family